MGRRIDSYSARASITSFNCKLITKGHMKTKIKTLIISLALAVTAGALSAAETVKVGVLHSLSGTMAISETSLKDVLLFTFDEINKSGGVRGKMIEPVVVDPASNWPLFAEKARQLIEQDKVAV